VSKAATRPQTRFVCQSCGESFLRWEGQCRACSAWNSLVETTVRAEPRVARPRHDGWTTAAKEHIIKLGYDVAYGARPLRRVIQNMVEDVLAEHLLLGKYEPGTTIVVDRDPEAGLDIHAAEPLTPVEA